MGVLLVNRDNDRRRDMTAADIVTAVGNIAAANPGGIDGRILVVNQFR